MNSLRNSLQFCAKAYFMITGGKVSKQYLQKKVKEIANIQKKILFVARQLIFKKLDFIPEFYEILYLSERCEKSVRSLITNLVYQYTNIKQRFEKISIFKERIEEILKHKNYILQRLDLIIKHWDVMALIKMSGDVTKKEQIQTFFKQKCIYLPEVKQQNLQSQIKKQIQLKRAEDNKLQQTSEGIQLSKIEVKRMEPQDEKASSQNGKDIDFSSVKKQKQQEQSTLDTKKQELNPDIVCVNDD